MSLQNPAPSGEAYAGDLDLVPARADGKPAAATPAARRSAPRS
jgi:hypothetical protein